MENPRNKDKNPFCAARGCGREGLLGTVTRQFSPVRSSFPFFTLEWGEQNPLYRIDLQVMKHLYASLKGPLPTRRPTHLSFARLQWFPSPESLRCPPQIPLPFCTLLAFPDAVSRHPPKESIKKYHRGFTVGSRLLVLMSYALTHSFA